MYCELVVRMYYTTVFIFPKISVFVLTYTCILLMYYFDDYIIVRNLNDLLIIIVKSKIEINIP